MNSKSEIRARILKKRLSLPSKKILESEKALSLIWNEFQSKNFKVINKIGLYWPINNELSTLRIIEDIISKKKLCYLPVIANKNEKNISFKNYVASETLIKNKYGIPEPLQGKTIEINSLDLIIVPLVAFDMKGNRIGMGQGFYDITLIKYKPLIPQLIGLGYDFQEELTCFPENHDIKLDGALTPSRIIEF